MTLRRALLALAVVALLALPLTRNTYVVILASRIAIFAILAISVDLVLGYSGLVTFGHAAFFGVGAYVTGALVHYGFFNGWLHFVLSIVGAGAVAFLVGLVSVRTRGMYFIMLTFAFAQMLFYLAIGQQQFGGDDGMPLSIRSQFGGLVNLGDASQFYYVALGCLTVVLLVCDRIVHSPFGLVVSACRQNEVRVQTVGFRTYWYKVTAFAISGAIAGLAGALIANLNAYVSPGFFDWKVSGDAVMMVVIGGLGTLWGGPLGAAVFIVLEAFISAYTDHWMAVFGPILVLVALFWKRGVVGLLSPRRRRK